MSERRGCQESDPLPGPERRVRLPKPRRFRQWLQAELATRFDEKAAAFVPPPE